jgi:hypothetical protein
MDGSTPATGISSSSQRLVSLDALRGFDMFWIVGADNIVYALQNVSQSSAALPLSAQNIPPALGSCGRRFAENPIIFNCLSLCWSGAGNLESPGHVVLPRAWDLQLPVRRGAQCCAR